MKCLIRAAAALSEHVLRGGSAQPNPRTKAPRAATETQEAALASGMASWEQERHSPAHTQQGSSTGEPLQPLWTSTRRALAPSPACTRRGWGCHTVPAAQGAKPTFPLTFSMLAHCIARVFIEVSAKAIQTLTKSRLGKNTAAWPKLNIFPALSEGLKS